jgi:gas vesicle protein
MAAAVVPATLFGVGLLVGAGVALMLAPKSGRELRRDLGRQANRIGESVRDRMPSLPNRDREMVDNNLASS